MVALIVIASVFSTPAGQVLTSVEDSTISARIGTLYLLNEHLNPFNINTTTRDGNVVITGSVNDEVQKELAEDLARSVKGVGFVDNRLVVINTVVGEKEQRTWKQRMSDRALSASVKSRMLMKGEFKGLKTGITTVNSVVTLYGVVPTEEHALAMARVAEETKGVAEVVNNLTVHEKEDAYDAVRGTGRKISDEWTELRVAKTMLLNRHLSIRELDVEVLDGICFLSGSVNSEEKKELAGQLADNIRGVVEVRNNIAVREDGVVIPSAEVEESEVPDAEPAPAPRPSIKGSEPLEDALLSGSEPNV